MVSGLRWVSLKRSKEILAKRKEYKTVVSGLRWVSLERSKEFLEHRKEYINGSEWPDMGFSEEECRVFGAKKRVYKRW